MIDFFYLNFIFFAKIVIFILWMKYFAVALSHYINGVKKTGEKTVERLKIAFICLPMKFRQ